MLNATCAACGSVLMHAPGQTANDARCVYISCSSHTARKAPEGPVQVPEEKSAALPAAAPAGAEAVEPEEKQEDEEEWDDLAADESLVESYRRRRLDEIMATTQSTALPPPPQRPAAAATAALSRPASKVGTDMRGGAALGPDDMPAVVRGALGTVISKIDATQAALTEADMSDLASLQRSVGLSDLLTKLAQAAAALQELDQKSK